MTDGARARVRVGAWVRVKVRVMVRVRVRVRVTLRHSQMSSGVILKREMAMAVFCEVLGSTRVTISSCFLTGPDHG